MEAKKFIEERSKNNANYNNPEQAITTANLCNTISRDINTDSQRFIYELLQNADDASNQNEKLDIQIDFEGDYVIISHKGEAFSKSDIKSISSAGDGTKTGDTNKTGFKGIGFKSVFSHSNFVIIKSGIFCFKFDKNAWNDHWNEAWGKKNGQEHKNWLNERREEGKDAFVAMPWQIIPIWTDLPIELKNLSVFTNFNVSTIIKYDKIENLKQELFELFSNSQIVLFLRSKEVKITVNGSEGFTIEKIKNTNTTILKRDNIILSEWLIKTEIFDIPQEIQKEIHSDEKSPKKLKDATKTEISFAIQLENGKLKAVDKENRLIFTYLPTSINYDFPFLVNASFLTDAGRQHLHQDIFWNNWIFKQIPLHYFAWIAELAHKNSKYNKQFLAVIPHKLGNSKLENSFNNGFIQAIDSIAFVPNLNGDLLKISDAIFDKINMSNCLNKQTIINYINFKNNSSLSLSSFVPYLEHFSTLTKLGIKIFDISNLEDFFASDFFTIEHKLQDNFKLISFFYEQAQKDVENDIWNEKLKNIAFIFDNNENLRAPKDIYFRESKFSTKFKNNIKIIHTNIINKINKNKRITNWLELLGIKEPSDISFIEKTIIGQLDTYITIDNALEIGRYLLNSHKKGVLQENHYEKLQKIKLLTKENNLISAKKSFLSDFYNPDLHIEKICVNDFYVSENYFEDKDLRSEWKTFLIKIGVNQNIELQNININKLNDLDKIELEYFEKVEVEARKGHSYPHLVSRNNTINVSKISYSELSSKSHLFAKLFWTQVFKNIKLDCVAEYAKMPWGYYGSSTNVENYFFWSLKNSNFIPTTQQTCLKSSEVYSSNIPQIKEIAGKYLPLFDYKEAISPEWSQLLNFKSSLDFNNYLDILSAIWQDSNLSESEQKENQERIGLIYEKLALINLHDSEKEIVVEWGKNNKLLAKNKIDFFYPKDLQLVTISGFNSKNIIFGDNYNENEINLLRLFGVSIIDTVIPTIQDRTIEKDLKYKLLKVAPLIALVAVEKSKNRKEWEIEFNKITQKLQDIYFFKASEIYLSYGNDEDKQKRSSWTDINNFYYVGNWYSPRILDGLIEPLGKFLNIRYAERILTVLLLENFKDGLEYLKEKGYDTSLIPLDLLNPEEIEIIDPEIPENSPYNSKSERLGNLGENFVYKELKRIYSQKYEKPIEDTPTGFKIGNSLEVFWRNISRNTTTNHDFKVVELGKEIYIDSKATPYGKNVDKIALYISGNELALMELAEKYLIARVFNVTKNPEMQLIQLTISDLD
jgi:hypothetical protein